MRPFLRGFAVALTTVLFAVPVGPASAAAPFDHLQCFRIKDSLEKTTYTADLTAADPIFVAAERGCTIQTPARMLCVDARKTSVEPVPPGAPDGEPAQTYLCYRAKCGQTRPSTVLEDQFGTHLFSINSTTMICAPVTRSSATTTTTLPGCTDADEDGWRECDGDCDDGNPAVNPDQIEVCDGLDNNCNGLTDSEDADLSGVGGPCSTGLPGVCSQGVLVCDGALECFPTVLPGEMLEVCDGVDDDCNGLVDESDPNLGMACDTGLAGPCSAGSIVCSEGDLLCQQQVAATDEVCDGIDNDCDGETDENVPGSGDPCSTGLLGACGIGEVACEGGGFQCVQTMVPQPEACDGVDNDCDGVVEQGPPIGYACNTGLPGMCQGGYLTCEGSLMVCASAWPPLPEVCDGLDNDCDGVNDNGVCNDDGMPCAVDAECLHQACVDGVCCDRACGGLCEACAAVKKGYGLDGICEPVTFGTDPDAECPASEVCDGTGSCLVAP